MKKKEIYDVMDNAVERLATANFVNQTAQDIWDEIDRKVIEKYSNHQDRWLVKSRIVSSLYQAFFHLGIKAASQVTEEVKKSKAEGSDGKGSESNPPAGK